MHQGHNCIAPSQNCLFLLPHHCEPHSSTILAPFFFFFPPQSLNLSRTPTQSPSLNPSSLSTTPLSTTAMSNFPLSFVIPKVRVFCQHSCLSGIVTRILLLPKRVLHCILPYVACISCSQVPISLKIYI